MDEMSGRFVNIDHDTPLLLPISPVIHRVIMSTAG